MTDRFDHLETQTTLPPSVRDAISRLDRFGHLELGSTTNPAPSAPASAPSPTNRMLCPHCHQSNEAIRDFCWACYTPLRPQTSLPNKPDEEQEIQLLLDGISYRSSDANLPDDVKALMARIRAQGFSQALLTEWKEWRTRRGFGRLQPPPKEPAGVSDPAVGARDPRVEAFQGQRVSILRLDGKLYKSDDDNLPPEIKEILDYIQRDGVTPALMQHLRLYGTKVKYRPLSAVSPSDGDVDFWRTARTFIQTS